MRGLITLFLLFVSAVVGAAQSSLSADQIPVPSTAENPASAPQLNRSENGEQRDPILKFFTLVDALPKDLEILRANLMAKNNRTTIEVLLQKLAADISNLQLEIRTDNAPPYKKKLQIDLFQRKLSILTIKLAQLKKTLTETITELSGQRDIWKKNEHILNDFNQLDGFQNSLDENEQQRLKDIVSQAIKLIDSRLIPSLNNGKVIAGLQAQLQQVAGDLRHLDVKLREARLKRSSPTLLDKAFYSQINKELFIGSYKNGIHFISKQIEILKNNTQKIFVGFFILIILCFTVYLSRTFVEASSYWYNFASRPFATAIFILVTSYHFFIKTVSLSSQNQESLTINIISMFAVIRLIRCCIVERWKKALFIRLTLFMAIIMLFVTLELSQILMLIFVFICSISALTVYFSRFALKCTPPIQYFIRKTWGILPATVVFTCLAGYDNLAIFLFTTGISSVALALVIWMLFHIDCGLLELFLKFIPISLFQDNISMIVRNLRPFIALAHIIILVGLLAVSWDIVPSFETALQSISDLSLDLFGFQISFGFIFTLFLVFYGTLLFSKGIQATLQKEVLPRYTTEKGVQLSITRLVHYGILTIGFIFMLKILGFGLSQLTLIGGALGVGIGFGLQAIVNNFVCGLILLFDRTIKVGDTIQIGSELGEVKNLGLRATVIQTFDNSEIVIPNSDLVTGNVTNWTLSERKVRVRIPVGAAYGSDVANVLRILQNCAESHPMVLSNPKPVALFLAFGESSLDFELRFWIHEVLDKMTAISELNQSIESEFVLNNIEIPFPQSDLHIKSVSSAAAQILKSGCSED